MRVLISGIGRSATTLLYQQVAKCMLFKFNNIRFAYEPYLWSLDQPQVQGAPFGVEMLSHRGIQVHKTTPLILNDSHAGHDKFAEELFGADLQLGESSKPDAYLTKFIRGAGRLESYIKRFPDLRIIACMRNPLETINSSMGFFSFLGDEYHESDREKLIRELAERNVPYLKPEHQRRTLTLIEGSVLWWRALTEETLRLADQYPRNICLFLHERYKNDPDAEIDSLVNFIPMLDPEIFEFGAGLRAGPSIKKNHLLVSDIDLIFPHLQFYGSEVLARVFSNEKIVMLQDELLRNTAGQPYTQPIAGDELGGSTSIQLRGRLLSGKQNPYRYSEPDPDDNSRLTLESTIREVCFENSLCVKQERKYSPDVTLANRQKTFGCVITCYNNQNTIVDSIVSALNQTRPFDQIVVVNDGSTDESQKIVESFCSRYPTVKILNLQHNVGVSAARHMGFLELKTDFITQLDGDDCFWPSKNLRESEIVLRQDDTVAFSDILIQNENKRFIQSTLSYDNDSRTVTRQLLQRQSGVPRDLTFARDLYFAAGGYDFRLSLYEDLDFKFRLAAFKDLKWRRSNAICGTIYNRTSPAASRDEGIRLPRALTEHFFRYVDKLKLAGIEAAEAYTELTFHHDEDWITSLSERLSTTSKDDLQCMKNTMLSRQMTTLADDVYVEAIRELCRAPSFNVIRTPWQLRYGVSNGEGPYTGFGPGVVHWQTARNCGFVINSRTVANGVRGLVYVPHLPDQKLNVIVEQQGNVVQQSFLLDGSKKDHDGNHLLHEVEIPIRLAPGDAKVSCIASSYVQQDDRERALYCLFAGWQLFC